MIQLEKEFAFYLDHQDELADKYPGRYVVIKDGTVIGVFDAELDAIEETAKKHELGTFLVQKCEKGDQSTTQTFHSRVVFA